MCVCVKQKKLICHYWILSVHERFLKHWLLADFTCFFPLVLFYFVGHVDFPFFAHDSFRFIMYFVLFLHFWTLFFPRLFYWFPPFFFFTCFSLFSFFSRFVFYHSSFLYVLYVYFICKCFSLILDFLFIRFNEVPLFYVFAVSFFYYLDSFFSFVRIF